MEDWQDPAPPINPERQHQMTTQSQSKQNDLDQHGRLRDHSPKQHRSHFRFNDRVVVYDKNGIGIHGTVKWIDELAYYGGSKLPAIGIETVSDFITFSMCTHNYLPAGCFSAIKRFCRLTTWSFPTL